jgi:16S rRNA (uracil1498-N3)-methyltransferase
VSEANAPWLLVEPGVLGLGGRVRLDPDESRHLLHALRRRAGDRVTLADGAGSVAEGVVEVASARGAEVTVDALRVEPPVAGPGVTLALSVLHSQAMDWAAQKVVELGVRRLVPVVAARSQLGQQPARGRVAHWRRVARQALKQCRRPWAMVVEDPLGLGEVAELGRPEGGLVADPAGEPLVALPPGCGRLLLVGPEGGLTETESRLLEAAGWRRLRLGPHVLRAETAAVVGAALLVNR